MSARLDRERPEFVAALQRASQQFYLEPGEILLPAAGGNPFGPYRETPQVAARRQIAVELRAASWSWPRIGRALGYRDHTAIMRGHRSCADADPPAPRTAADRLS